MNKQEEQRQFARDLCACYVDQSFGWDEDSVIDAVKTTEKLYDMGYRHCPSMIEEIFDDLKYVCFYNCIDADIDKILDSVKNLWLRKVSANNE